MPQLLTVSFLVFLNYQRGKIIPAPIDEDADSQLDEVTDRKLDDARKTFVNNSADLFTWHYLERTSRLSILQKILSPEQRQAQLSPLPGSPMFLSRTIDNVPAPLSCRATTIGTLHLTTTQGSGFTLALRPWQDTGSPPFEFSRQHRAKGAGLSFLLNSRRKSSRTGDKKDHDPVLNPVIIILAMLINAGIRPGDFISRPGQSKGSLPQAIS